MKIIGITILLLAVMMSSSWGSHRYASIDSLSGNAQMMRSGAESWVSVSQGDRLVNNDVVRVLDKGFARIRLSKGAMIHVRGGSQVLINLYAPPKPTTVSEHITLFFGAIFFTVKSSLPETGTTSHDYKVYTPAAVAACRGTAFMVEVAKGTGETAVKVLNGTVLVRNIIKNESLFLRAGGKSVIGMNQDPTTPRALVSADIASMKSWVSPLLIEQEMVLQNTKAHRDHEIITGRVVDQLSVFPFANATTYTGAWDIATGLSRFLVERLDTIPGFPRATLMTTGTGDPLSEGALSRSRYIVTGTIEEVDIIQQARISVRADRYEEINYARMRLRLSLIEVASRRQIMDEAFIGEIPIHNSPEHTWESVSQLPFDMRDQRFRSSILGKVIDQVLNSAASELCRYVREER